MTINSKGDNNNDCNKNNKNYNNDNHNEDNKNNYSTNSKACFCYFLIIHQKNHIKNCEKIFSFEILSLISRYSIFHNFRLSCPMFKF